MLVNKTVPQLLAMEVTEINEGDLIAMCNKVALLRNGNSFNVVADGGINPLELGITDESEARALLALHGLQRNEEGRIITNFYAFIKPRNRHSIVDCVCDECLSHQSVQDDPFMQV